MQRRAIPRPAQPAHRRVTRTSGPDKIELPEFEVTSMKEVEGTCPAAPAIRK